MILGLLKIKNNNQIGVLVKYIRYSIFITFFGYLWFLIKFPEIPSGDTIKSSYIIQLFHLMAVLSSLYIEQIRKRSEKIYKILLMFLLLVFTHNIPAMMSHF